MGVFDDKTMALINQTYQRADAFLFGRRTHELFAGYWGAEQRARAATEDPATPDRSCPEHEAEVPRIDHAHRAAMGEHDPPLR